MKNDRFLDKYGLISKMDMKRPTARVFYWLLFALCCFLVLICLLPPLYVILSSLKTDAEFNRIPPTIIPHSFDLSKLKYIWENTNFGTAYFNSLMVIIGCVASTLIFNGLAGYTISILKPKGYKFAFWLIMFSLMIPTVINMVPVFSNVSQLGLMDTYFPIWLSYGCNAYQIVLFKSFFDGISPSLIEAAQLDGCSAMKTFTRIVLPISKPIVMVISILTVNAAWSDFMLPYLVLRDEQMKTVMVKLYGMQTGQLYTHSQIMVAVLFAIIPPTIIFCFFSKYFTEGVSIGSVKG